MMRWYRYETGNERRKDELGTFLRRSGIRYSIETDKTKNCDWWRVQILADEKQVETINRWLNTH